MLQNLKFKQAKRGCSQIRCGGTWIKSCTEKHVLSLTSVKNRIDKIMKDYENRVRTVNSSNNKAPTSLRARNKLWMSMDVLKPKTKKVISKIVKTHPYLTSVETWRQQRTKEVM